MTWVNDDGLTVRFGTEKAATVKGSNEFGTYHRMVVNMTNAVVLDADTADPMTAAGQAAYRDEVTPFIPAGAYVTRAYFFVTTAFTGASGALDIGLMEADGSVIDIDFFDDDVGVAALGANAVVACNGAGVGGAVKVSADAYVCFADDPSNAFTAGAGYLVVEYITV